jgi:type I restriction enzyme S subunit
MTRLSERWVALGQVADLCLGKMLDARKNKGRLLPYLRNPNVRWFEVDTNDVRLMPFEEHEDDRYGLRAGDVVICEGGEAGRAAIWDGRIPHMKFQKAIHRVRPSADLDARYLVHRLMADYHNGGLADYYTGATIKHLTGQDLSRYRFPLPPLAEQRRIAEILDKADALRTQRRTALAQLETLTQSILFDMFGDLTSNPRKLPTRVLAEVCTRVTDGTHQPPRWSTEGHPFLFVSNVVSGEITFQTEKYISDETHAELTRRCPIEMGDVLYSTVGSYGVPALVRSHRKFAFQRHIAHLKPDQRAIAPAFLKATLASPSTKRQADRVARGVAQKTLNLADIREFRILVPPINAQREFVRRVTAWDRIKRDQLSALEGLDALFSSLQHRAFRGEL